MQALGWKLRDVFWRWAQRFAGSDPRRGIVRCVDLCWFAVPPGRKECSSSLATNPLSTLRKIQEEGRQVSDTWYYVTYLATQIIYFRHHSKPRKAVGRHPRNSFLTDHFIPYSKMSLLFFSNIAGPSRLPLQVSVAACHRAASARFYATEAQEPQEPLAAEQSEQSEQSAPVDELSALTLDPSKPATKSGLEKRGGKVFYRDWLRYEGEQFRVPQKGQKAKWLGGNVVCSLLVVAEESY